MLTILITVILYLLIVAAV